MQIDDTRDIDVILPMHNLTVYSNNYSKTSWILWQHCRDEAALANSGHITDYNEGNTTISFDLKEKITGQTGNNMTKNVELWYH